VTERPGTGPPILRSVSDRPAIKTIEGDVEGDDARITVVLDLRGEQFFGQALGDARPQHRARLAGEAALRAVESLARGSATLDLLAIAAADLGDQRVALAQVGLPDGSVLVGSALIRDGDTQTAAVKAVMDALNRRLPTLL